MGYIKVRNKKGTGNNNPPAGYTSWLDFWEKKKGKKATVCGASHCPNRAEHGGHVIKSGYGPKEFIIPICALHNNKPDSEEFFVLEENLISVQ